MVAEAVKETPEVTQPEADALTTPEDAPELTSQESETESSPDYTGVLKELGFEDETTGADDGQQAPTDGGAPSLKTLTPEQAFEEGKKAKEAEAEAAVKQYNSRAYLDGVTRSFQSVFDELDRKADELGLDADNRKWLKDRFTAHNGQWKTLHDFALNEGVDQAKGSMRNALTDVGKKFTGVDDFEPGKSLDEYVGKIAEHARKGYLSPAEVKAERKKAREDTIERIIKAGGSVPGYSESALTNLPGANGGARGPQPKNYAEAEAWHVSGKWDNAQMREYERRHPQD